MRRYIAKFSFVALLCFAAIGCDENLSDIAGPSTPDLEPTFASIQQFVFETAETGGRRNCTACHTNINRPNGPAAGLNLLHDVAYDQLVNVASQNKPGAIRVVPGNADASYIVHKVEGRPGIVGARMPINGPYLSDGQILILKRWIDLGAPRN
jgi:hypothetical protein